jgi:hypothetical protein
MDNLALQPLNVLERKAEEKGGVQQVLAIHFATREEQG